MEEKLASSVEKHSFISSIAKSSSRKISDGSISSKSITDEKKLKEQEREKGTNQPKRWLEKIIRKSKKKSGKQKVEATAC